MNYVFQKNIMDLNAWIKKNDELYEKAVGIMADEVIDYFVCSDDLINATDLQECDGDHIQRFYDVQINYNRYPEDDEPFSIKDFIDLKKHGWCHYLLYSPFEKYVSENWEDALDEELVEAIQDRVKVGEIVGKYCYGGGGYEVQRDLELDVVEKIAEKLKEKFLKKQDARLLREDRVTDAIVC